MGLIWGPIFAALAIPSQTELDRFIALPQSQANINVASRRRGSPARILLTSQAWMGSLWKHDVRIQQPKRRRHSRTALLFVTGGDANPADLRNTQKMADLSGMPVVTLFHIPNQPLFGKSEDALIAYTIEQYLKTGDSKWPLLFPMVKSVDATMDAVVRSFRRTRTPISKFVVFGASKRGWTTWLAASTGDPRIVGIAPQIFDNLGIKDQMSHQKHLWGRYSDEIADYEKNGLLDILESPPGKKLLSMLDPLAYKSRWNCPVLMVNGANDPYWATDALIRYWDKIPVQKNVSVMPNIGHEFGDHIRSNAAISAFAASCAGEFAFPSLRLYRKRDEGGAMVSTVQSSVPGTLRLVYANSKSLDFRKSKWNSVTIATLSGPKLCKSMMERSIPRPDEFHFRAYYYDVEYKIGRHKFWLSTPPIISY